MVGKTAAQRMAAQRVRRKEGGLKRREWWLDDHDWQKVKRYIERLARKRNERP